MKIRVDEITRRLPKITRINIYIEKDHLPESAFFVLDIEQFHEWLADLPPTAILNGSFAEAGNTFILSLNHPKQKNEPIDYRTYPETP